MIEECFETLSRTIFLSIKRLHSNIEAASANAFQMFLETHAA